MGGYRIVKKSKPPCMRIMIEGCSYEAKAMADSYEENKKYEVLERSKPYPQKNGKVRIFLHVVKKARQRSGKHKRRDNDGNYIPKQKKADIKTLMQRPF